MTTALLTHCRALALGMAVSACAVDGGQRSNYGAAHSNMADQFGRLIGHWHIMQETRQIDGSWMQAADAQWTFEYTLGGAAIQDTWIQPPLGSVPAPGTVRQHGVNIRVYDPDQDLWRIVWVSSDDRTFTDYSAKQQPDGTIVMLGSDPTRSGVTQRITYFDITPEQWSWRLEFSDDQTPWLEVARIRASRIQGPNGQQRSSLSR